MQVFEINILRKAGDSWPVVVEHSQPDLFLPVRIESILHLSVEELRTQVMPLEYGMLLGRALFHEQVRDALMAALAGPEKQVRVLLYVEAKDLQALHWERLCAPLDGGWAFLSANQRTPFSLYLPAVTDRRFPPIGRPDLCALVVVASPQGLNRYGMAPFDEAAVARSVTQALGDIPYALLANLPAAAGPPTLDAFCAQIVAQRYTLVHVVCHGRYDHASGETSLFLANDHNEVDRVDATRLIERLRRLDNARGLPHLVFLAACDTAHPEAEEALGGLAQRLVRELGMPAVIAMSDQVTLETVERLTTTFYRKLADRGEVDVALGEASSLLARGNDIVVPALYSRLGERALFSEALDRPLTNSQIAKGLDRLTQYLPERAPVFQPKFHDLAQTLRSTLSTDDQVLSTERRSERTAALDALNTICVEVLDISFAGLALGKQPPTYDARCPFRGLGAFRLEDHAFFFGREPLVREMTARVKQEQFLAVLGPSGSGKSSLVLAGVVPLLQTEQPALRVLTMTPGAQPVERLEAMLGAAPASSAHIPTLLIIDQFEELFTLCKDEPMRQHFLERIIALMPTSSVVNRQFLWTIITMRTNFLNDCAHHLNFYSLLEAHQMLISSMMPTEYHSVLTQQTAVVGLRFEADLVNTMVDDVSGEPGAMALLQHTLIELWQRRHGRWLKTEEYRSIGGVRDIITRMAEHFYLALSNPEQLVLQDLFLRLVRLDTDSAAHDTHHRVRFEELLYVSGEERRLATLIDKVVDARLVITGGDFNSSQKYIEIAHITIITHWQRLRNWVSIDRHNLLLRQAMSDAARQWQANHREWGYLYRGQRLRQIRDQYDKKMILLNLSEQEFLSVSIRNNWIEQVLRWSLASAGVTLLVLLLYSIITERGPFAPQLSVEAVEHFAFDEVSDILWLDANTVLAGVSKPDGTTHIRRSFDGGVTWADQPIPGAFVNALAVDPNVPHRLYALVQEAGLLRSEDGGQQWDLINSLSDWNCPYDIAVAPDGLLYLGNCRNRQGIFTSMDQGLSWAPTPNTPEINGIFVNWTGDHLLVGGGSTGLWTYEPQQGWRSWFEGEPISILEAADYGDSLVAGGNGIYRITQTGGPQPISVRQVKSLALDAGAPAFFLAATKEDQLLWGEFNSGRVWQIAEYLVDSQPPPQIQVIRAQPATAATFWISAKNGLYKAHIHHWFELLDP